MSLTEDLYRRIVEAMPEGVWLVDPQGRTIVSNRRMAEILGTDVESLSKQSYFEFVFADDLDNAQRHIAQSITGRSQPIDLRLRRGDGSAIWVSVSCGPVGNGLLCSFSAISERKKTDAVLRESDAHLWTAYDKTAVLICASGPDKLATFFSTGWLSFTGRTLEQELRFGWTENVHPDDIEEVLTRYSAAFDSRKSCQIEYRLRRADGEYRSVVCTGGPHYTADGAFMGYIASCLDITELKRTLEVALSSQKTESLGHLARGVAHDFNNLLGGILSTAEAALAVYEEGSNPKNELQLIRTAAIRGGEIVRQLMTYGGEGDPAFEQVDVLSLINEMLQLLRVSISKRVVLDTDLGQGLPAVEASSSQIRQVVMNLVTNASEAIGERHGVIRIATSKVTVGRDAVLNGTANLRPGDYVKVVVADTGSGMTPEVQSKIFDPFFTTKRTGRGLGLAAVQGIVRSHNGAINVVSSLGQGTSFEVLLPCTNKAVELSPDIVKRPSSNEMRSVSGTVLVVEDEDTLRFAVSKMLRMKGYSAIEAIDGRTAVDLFRANAPEIDVVLLDLTLPMMSGPEVFAEVRRIRPDVAVILTSAYGEEATLSAFGGQHAWAFIRKPYQINEVTKLIWLACLQRPRLSNDAVSGS